MFCWLWKTAWHGDALKYQCSSYALVWVMTRSMPCSIPLSKPTLSFLLWASRATVYPKKYAHGFCFAVLCCGYTLIDFPISIRLTSLALWQSNDCPSASKATLMNMDKYFMWIHYERLHIHNKAKHNKTVCIFLGIYCRFEHHHSIVTLRLSCHYCADIKLACFSYSAYFNLPQSI